MQILGRSETLLATHVEQSAHLGQTLHIQGHDVGSETEEVRGSERVRRGQARTVLLIVQVQQVDTTQTGGSVIGAAGVEVIERVSNHRVDDAGSQTFVLQRHGFVNLVEDHGGEGVHLRGGHERGLELTVENGLVELECHHVVEDLSFGAVRLVDVGIVACAVGQIPRLVDGGFRQIGLNLHHDGSILP